MKIKRWVKKHGFDIATAGAVAIAGGVIGAGFVAVKEVRIKDEVTAQFAAAPVDIGQINTGADLVKAYEDYQQSITTEAQEVADAETSIPGDLSLGLAVLGVGAVAVGFKAALGDQ